LFRGCLNAPKSLGAILGDLASQRQWASHCLTTS
jgi:hypothetical protein